MPTLYYQARSGTLPADWRCSSVFCSCSVIAAVLCGLLKRKGSEVLTLRNEPSFCFRHCSEEQPMCAGFLILSGNERAKIHSVRGKEDDRKACFIDTKIFFQVIQYFNDYFTHSTIKQFLVLWISMAWFIKLHFYSWK